MIRNGNLFFIMTFAHPAMEAGSDLRLIGTAAKGVATARRRRSLRQRRRRPFPVRRLRSVPIPDAEDAIA
jgi:hypothetical protein